jgi:hypothetical protein
MPLSTIQTLFLVLLIQITIFSPPTTALPHNSVHAHTTRLHHSKHETNQHAALDRMKTMRAARALQAQATAPPSSTFNPQPQLIALTPPLASAAAEKPRRVTPMKELKYSSAHRLRQDVWLDTASWMEGKGMRRVERAEGAGERVLRPLESKKRQPHRQDGGDRRDEKAAEMEGEVGGTHGNMSGDEEAFEGTLRPKGRKRPASSASAAKGSSTPSAVSEDYGEQVGGGRGL